MGEGVTKLIDTPLFKKAQHDRDTAMELSMGNHSQWGSHRGMEAVRPPLFFFCFFVVVTCLYVLGLVLWKKRDERQRDADI
jgi:hypothetical protein